MADTTAAENIAAQFRDAAADAARTEARMKAQQRLGHATAGLQEKCRARGMMAPLNGIWCPLTAADWWAAQLCDGSGAAMVDGCPADPHVQLARRCGYVSGLARRADLR